MSLPPFVILFLGFIGLCIIGSLILLPASPRTKWLFIPWVMCLAAILWFYVSEFAAPGLRSVWVTPTRSLIVQAVLLFLPFAVSLWLWKRRFTAPESHSESQVVLIILVVFGLSYWGLQKFNMTCVTYDYGKGSVTAWCAASWQSTRR